MRVNSPMVGVKPVSTQAPAKKPYGTVYIGRNGNCVKCDDNQGRYQGKRLTVQVMDSERQALLESAKKGYFKAAKQTPLANVDLSKGLGMVIEVFSPPKGLYQGKVAKVVKPGEANKPFAIDYPKDANLVNVNVVFYALDKKTGQPVVIENRCAHVENYDTTASATGFSLDDRMQAFVDKAVKKR
ncbi:MAG: hypothetical protein QM765_40510 [Myxococcales bacterium]